MPCLYITTNINLDGVNTDQFHSDVIGAIATIVGRPQDFVMVVLKGSIEIVFGGNKLRDNSSRLLPEIVSMGGITKQVKRQLISTVGSILHTHFSIHPSRFIFKVFDMRSLPLPSKL